MKQAAALVLFVAMVFCLPAHALADYEPYTDYMEIMIASAAAGDVTAGREAQLSRDEKISDMHIEEYSSVDFDELYLLSKLIDIEAGSEWLPDEWKLAVGEVALNRVTSPEFPDTLEDVIDQPGQYYGPNSSFFDSHVPSRHSAELAAQLLSGTRVLGNTAVVFQSNAVQGSGVFLEMHDKLLGSTFFCLSNYTELYA